MHDKEHHLALLDVVETYNTYIAVGVLRAALLNFRQYFLRALGVEQGQLPHGPVVNLGVRGFVELNAGDVALVEHVLDLTVDLSIRQRRQVRKGFVTNLFG